MNEKEKRRRTGSSSGNGNVDDIIHELKEKFGKEVVKKYDEVLPVTQGVISTGSLSLDIALGVGGLPRGRIIEIFGAESSGKTTLALHTIASAQKNGGTACFIDMEHALDINYAEKCGVNVRNLIISQPDNGDQALELVDYIVKTGKVDVVVIDSVAALVPKEELEAGITENQMGLQARLMSKAMRMLSGPVSSSRTVCIFINQVREKIGVFFGNPETTPGGNALKFYSSVRIHVSQKEKLTKGDKVIGIRVKAKIVKNKVAPPHTTAEFDILFDEGISLASELIDLGVKYGVILKSGSWYSYGDIKLGQGKEEARLTLKSDNHLLLTIKEEILKKAFETRELPVTDSTDTEKENLP